MFRLFTRSATTPPMGEQHRRDEGRRPHRPEQGGGACLPQEVQGQGKAQDGVAEQGDDLPDDHQGKIPAKQGRLCLLHHETLLL